jgi:hypothetical protein
VQWVQAISQALTVSFIATAGVWIAWQQARFARVKLQHDLFDRRFAVFDAARKFLGKVARGGRVRDDAFRDYSLDTIDALFLTDEATASYLDEIRRRAIRHQMLQASLEDVPVGEERSHLVRQQSEITRWVVEQLDQGHLVAKFSPFVALEPKRRGL